MLAKPLYENASRRCASDCAALSDFSYQRPAIGTGPRGSEHGGNVTPMPEPSILSVLRERARLQRDDTAFTFTEHDADWAGFAESLM